MRRLSKFIAWLAVLGGGLVLALTILLMTQDEARPRGREGEAAEALAARMEEAVDIGGWARTGAVRWDFAGRHQHLWDRQRDLVRVRWGDVEVFLHEGTANGIAYRGGAEVGGAEGWELRQDANAYWVNDSFWLNPIAKIHDTGVTRSIIGDDELLVEYSSGGLTPGDAYLWTVGEDGLPTSWKLWVSIVPIGGVEVTWESWVTLSTGARVATRHVLPGGFTLQLTDVEGARSLGELIDGPDPFAVLLAD